MSLIYFIKNISFTTILLVFLNFGGEVEAQIIQGMSLERLSRIDPVMQGYVDLKKVAGNVVYVTRNGHPVYHKAFGLRDVASNDEMQHNDLFRIASQSKAITSVGIMMLQEQGELLINHPVGKYLPEYMETSVAENDENGGYKIVPAKRQITIRDLLTHTAGVSYGQGPAAQLWKKSGIYGWYTADRGEPIRETVRRIASLPQAAHPGEKFVYGYNTDILGAVIEVVSGKPLDQFLKDSILDPLHMYDTHFYVPDYKKDRVATVYSLKGEKINLAENPGQMEGQGHVGQGHYINGPRISFAGGAGLVSTTQNYGTFLQMILNGGELNGTRILSRKSIELMTQDHLGNIPYSSGKGFGLGFEIITNLGDFGQIGSQGAYGWGGAYNSTYWIDPIENIIFIYLTQLIPDGGLDEENKLRALIYQAIVD